MLKKIRLEEGWSILFLVWSMVFVSAWALYEAEYLEGLGIFMVIGTVGVLAGLLLAKSQFSDNTATIFALVYGAALIIFLIGRTFPADMEWRVRITEMIGRQVDWLAKAFGGGTSRDGLIFIIQTSVIFWLLGYTASWYTFRRPRVWRVVLPSGVVLLSVVYYYYGDKPLGLLLGLYFLLALMYVVRTYLVSQERDWRSAAVRYEPGINFTFLRAGLLASILALVIASSLPTLTASAAVGDALTGVGGPWRAFQDNWTRLFSSLRSYGSASNDLYQGSLVLGGPRTVSNNIVMDVYVEEEMPFVYWQADVLATYENELWSPLDAQSVLYYPEDGVLNTPFTLGREVITQTVVNYVPNAGTVYAAPEIIGVDRQAFVRARETEEGDTLPDGLRSRYLLRPGDFYEVQSRVSFADATSLRTAATDYPDWVAEAYLQLPDTLTPETLGLAEEITAPYDNPFEKALAVRDYLRQNITYNDQVDAPPEDIEPIHYTLFIGKEGYCNYYASAMAVMLRSQGVPTRLVRGYAQGDYLEDLSAYRVRANNAHTWVEVYFPEYGWIQFEPTASIPLVDRPETAAAGGDGFDSLNPATRDPLTRDELLGEDLGAPDEADLLPEDVDVAGGADPTTTSTPISSWRIVAALVMVALLGVVFYIANEFNSRVESDVNRSYGRLESWARWLGIFFRPAQTPYERADELAIAVPEGKGPIRSLTQQFVLRTFSPHRKEVEGFDPAGEWKVLRPLMLRKTLINKLSWLRRGEKGDERYRFWTERLRRRD